MEVHGEAAELLPTFFLGIGKKRGVLGEKLEANCIHWPGQMQMQPCGAVRHGRAMPRLLVSSVSPTTTTPLLVWYARSVVGKTDEDKIFAPDKT